MVDSKALQQLMSYTRRAVDQFDMIEDGDRIAVGVSGGKDSLALLCALNGLSRFYPKKFEIVPVNLRMGFPDEDDSVSRGLCEELGLELKSFDSEIYSVVFEIRKEKHPCSLCANMRRGALHSAAKELGCNKLALGHHFDDAVETIIMNLFIEGRFDCFNPVTYLSRSDMTVIRPLLYTPEKDISHFIRKSGIVPVPKNCPADGNTKREDAKRELAALERRDRGVKQRIFNAFFAKKEQEQ
ncbi:MAG: tRNA 2-thiocytidine(32) synthetase TtcA [Clostridia bacterium]|nr:tRNA 2-thiocytidine(32) synthetase TtcA [Clostridia bacterium]MBQ9848662.1 tRNA 2-thiocytidine(32) synthetase TtcA [Clostridia bacterium]